MSTTKQQSLLDSIAQSCGRLAEVIDQMSLLSQTERGESKFNRRRLDLRALLPQAVSELPEQRDRDIQVTLTTGEGAAIVNGDAERLKTAFVALFHGLRRELVLTNEFEIRENERSHEGRSVSWIVFGPPDMVGDLESATPNEMDSFDEWRSGNGLSLPIARRVIDAHGGRIWERIQEVERETELTGVVPLKVKKAAAVVMLPIA